MAAFAKRLLQVASTSPPAFAAGSLLLVSELFRAKPALWGMASSTQAGMDDEVEDVRDIDDGGSDDDGVEDVRDVDDGGSDDEDGDGDGGKSKSKRGGGGKGNGGGAKSNKRISVDKSNGDDTEKGEGSDGEDGVNDSDTDDTDTVDAANGDGAAERGGAGAGVSASADSSGGAAAAVTLRRGQWPRKGGYDMRKRDPRYANADRSCAWELSLLASHTHPSVAAMARTLLAGQQASHRSGSGGVGC